MYDTPTTSGRGHSIETNTVPAEKFCIYRSDRWTALKYFHEFTEAIFDGAAWNRYDTRWRAVQDIPPTGPEYVFKRSVSIDPTVASRLNFFMIFRRLFSIELRGIGTASG